MYGLEVGLDLLYVSIFNIFSDVVTFVQPRFFAINCLDYEISTVAAISNEIESARLRFCAEFPPPSPILCLQVLNTVKQLRQRSVNYIHRHDLSELVHGGLIDRPSISDVLNHLHNLGKIIVCTQGALADIIIINMQWLFHDIFGWVFCSVQALPESDSPRIQSFQLAASQGPVDLSTVPIPAALEGQYSFLEIIESFDLCAQFGSGVGEKVVFPLLLSINNQFESVWHSNSGFTHHIGLSFICKSETMAIPQDFIPRLQLQINNVIKFDSHLASLELWQNGILFGSTEEQCLIRLSPYSRAFYVNVRGSSSEKLKKSRQLLQKILKSIYLTSELFPGIGYDIEFPAISELSAYNLEPVGYQINDVHNARLRGLRVVHSVAGQVDVVKKLLGFDSSGLRDVLIFNIFIFV